MPLATSLPEAPIFEVCGADNDPMRYFLKVIERMPEDVADLASRRRCLKRYFGDVSASDLNLGIDAVAKRYCTQSKPKCKACPLRYNCAFAIRQAQTSTDHSLKLADLFCGAGGLSLGFEQAGFATSFALDNDYWSVNTFRYNRPTLSESCVVHSDIAAWLKAPGVLPEIDVLAGGVPCQSFSNANQQRQRNDPRSQLFVQLFNAVDLIRPKVVVIENVSGFQHVGNSVERYFDAHGYAASYCVIDGSNYGLPQRRKRIFYIGFSYEHFRDATERVESSIASIIKAGNMPRLTLADAIEDLPSLKPLRSKYAPEAESSATGYAMQWHDITHASDYVHRINGRRTEVMVYNHKARYNNDRDIKIFSLLRQGEDSTAPKIRSLMPYKSRSHIFKDKYFKLRNNEPSRTITAHMRWDCNSYIHPHQPRGLTAREAARIQSFPDDYVFTGTFQRLYQQIGNAVPPIIARMLGNTIRRHINLAYTE